MDDKTRKSSFPCPCLNCALGQKDCIHRSAWQVCKSYRRWINWTWARFRGQLRRMQAREAQEAERAKKGAWRYWEPYLLEGSRKHEMSSCLGTRRCQRGGSLRTVKEEICHE